MENYRRPIKTAHIKTHLRIITLLFELKALPLSTILYLFRLVFLHTIEETKYKNWVIIKFLNQAKLLVRGYRDQNKRNFKTVSIILQIVMVTNTVCINKAQSLFPYTLYVGHDVSCLRSKVFSGFIYFMCCFFEWGGKFWWPCCVSSPSFGTP